MNINLTKEEKEYVIYLYSSSRQYGFNRHDRLLYTIKWFMKEFPIYKEHPKSVYLLIDELTKVLMETKRNVQN